MPNYVTMTSDKSKKKALLLCLFLGLFGAHNFYVGKYFRGIVFFFTVGLVGFGWIIDLFRIANGTFRDNVGAPLRH